MKLAEALIERKRLMQHIDSLRARAINNATSQEGEDTDEDPIDLIEQIAVSVDQLRDLIVRINSTNNATPVGNPASPSYTSISEAVVSRDMLNLHRSALEQVFSASNVRGRRYSADEIKNVCNIPRDRLRACIDLLSKQHRELDAAIQAANWGTELLS